MKISYCITACNEHEELERLLRFLWSTIRKEDEVIIQLDTNHTSEVLEVCNLFTNFNHTGHVTVHEIPNSKFYTFDLNKNFGRFKNNLASHSTGDYIFQIDADEIPSKELIDNLPGILESNPDNEVYLVPRINTVDGLTPEHVQKWGWNVDINGFVNFPDYQWRIYKNDSKIVWINKVHERLAGYKTYAPLPAVMEYCLLHHKQITRQETQNAYYDTI
jgi:glycosyltransferase involved in cell wall biosynthesis